MSQVTDQYDTYPYPERDPKDERKRLISGSPSNLMEVDHFVFGGKRDWSQPIRALVAGGGSGDGAIQLAQGLVDAGCSGEVVYLDLSKGARRIAEQRAKVRGLTNISFHTGSLLDAPEHGVFDYIDCCGVLHHLPDPPAGIGALGAALAPGGGMGLMVYAPYGRSGVYPLQEAFAVLGDGMSPQDRLTLGQATLPDVFDCHPFKSNRIVGDHEISDAGFYDLLLHTQDRPYTVGQFVDLIKGAGLGLIDMVQANRYDLGKCFPALAERARDLSKVAAMDVCEKLRGDIKMHVAYVAAYDRADKAAAKASDPTAVPHITGGRAQALVGQIARTGRIELTREDSSDWITLPKPSAKLLALVDGRRNLQQIAGRACMDWFTFQSQWGRISRELVGYEVMLYSQRVR